MKFTLALFSLLSASAIASPSIFGNQIKVTEEPLPVPGSNPLLYCADPSSYILSIDHVDLSPNPPSAGTDLVISANGTLSTDIEPGAKVHLQVKYGLIRILNQEVDLCEQADKVDLECPIKKGEMTLTKTVQLPKEIPPGKYTVLADVYTKDNEKITCLTATVLFKRGGAAQVVLGSDDL